MLLPLWAVLLGAANAPLAPALTSKAEAATTSSCRIPSPFDSTPPVASWAHTVVTRRELLKAAWRLGDVFTTGDGRKLRIVDMLRLPEQEAVDLRFGVWSSSQRWR